MFAGSIWVAGVRLVASFVVEGQSVTLNDEGHTLGMGSTGESPQKVSRPSATMGEAGPLTIPSLGVWSDFLSLGVRL